MQPQICRLIYYTKKKGKQNKARKKQTKKSKEKKMP
jgi:hypothetical protein